MVVVYLDSSDYSVLSDPRRCTPETLGIRDTLLEFARSQRVRFAFSGAHVSEMAPIEPQYTPSAIGRAKLLVDLCGTNSLISFDQLLLAEFSRLFSRNPEPPQVMRTDGTWFPDLGDILPPQVDIGTTIVGEVDALLKQSGRNRHERRAARRKLVKHSRPKPAVKELIAKQDPKTGVAEVVAKYPMRPEDAETLGKYVLHQATRLEAEDAFRNSLRDPRWLMQWFASHHDMLRPLIEWMREPSRKMAAEVRALTASFQKYRSKGEALRLEMEELRKRGLRIPPDLHKAVSSHDWRPDEDAQLVTMTKRMMETHGFPADHAVSAAEIDRFCAGWSTAVRTMYASAADAVAAHSRLPKDSDFLDVVHAMYAPYVSYFRADRYMSTHLRKYVPPHVHIAANLRELIVALEAT